MFRRRKKDGNDPSSPFDGLRKMAPTRAASDVGAAVSPETKAIIDLPVFWGTVPTSIPDIIGAIQDVITELRRVEPDEPPS